MKSIVNACLLFLLHLTSSQAQSILSVNPNQGAAGTTVVGAIVTGQGTFFQASSPQGNIRTRLESASGCYVLDNSAVAVIDDDHLSVDYDFPPDMVDGAYDVVVLSNAYTIRLNGGFSITSGLPTALSGVAPSSGVQGQSVLLQITGSGLDQFMNSPGAHLVAEQPGRLPISLGGYTVVNPGLITVSVALNPYRWHAGFHSIVLRSDNACIRLDSAFECLPVSPLQLISVTPATATAGTTWQAVVTGQNMFFQTGSPSSGFRFSLSHDCERYTAVSNLAITEDDIPIEVNLPADASNGLYDLVLEVDGNSYALNQVVTVSGGVWRSISSIAPTQVAAGQTYSFDIQGVGIADLLNYPPVSYELTSPAGIRTQGTLNSVVSNDELIVDFPISPCADSGSYDLRIGRNDLCSRLTGALTVTGGVPGGLHSFTPQTVYRYRQVTAQVTGACTFFSVGTSSIQSIAITRSGAVSVAIPTGSCTVVNDTTLEFPLLMRQQHPLGFYGFQMRFSDGRFYQLPVAFELKGIVASGRVYLDADSNGIYSPGDVYLDGIGVRQLPDSLVAYTDVDGTYYFGLDTGSQVIEPIPPPGWTTSGIASHNLNIVQNDTSGLDFAIRPLQYTHAPEVTLTPVSPPRCLTSALYQLRVINHGTTAATGTAYCVLDTALTFISAVPPPDRINGDTLFWDYTGVFVNQAVQFNLTVGVPGTAGQSLLSTVCATDFDGTVQLAQDCYPLSQVVTCAYDPNDKSVQPPGVGTFAYTLRNEELTYLIRFQNTGNDTAFTVVLLDTLDPGLDRTSFHVTNMTHPVQTSMTAEGVLQFRFENILLPDSNIDEPGSHGFVEYRIRPRSDLTEGSVIENRANIYFDLNAPIVTNTTSNTMVSVIPGVRGPAAAERWLSVYPNPASDRLVVETVVHGLIQPELRLVSTLGDVVSVLEMSGARVEFSLSGLSNGIYFIQLVDKTGTLSVRPVVVAH